MFNATHAIYIHCETWHLYLRETCFLFSILFSIFVFLIQNVPLYSLTCNYMCYLYLMWNASFQFIVKRIIHISCAYNLRISTHIIAAVSYVNSRILVYSGVQGNGKLYFSCSSLSKSWLFGVFLKVGVWITFLVRVDNDPFTNLGDWTQKSKMAANFEINSQ